MNEQDTSGLFGTREDDMWLVDDSEVGRAVIKKGLRNGENWHLVMWFHDGQESLFVTDNAEMVAEAAEGRKRYNAERALSN